MTSADQKNILLYTGCIGRVNSEGSIGPFFGSFTYMLTKNDALATIRATNYADMTSWPMKQPVIYENTAKEWLGRFFQSRKNIGGAERLAELAGRVAEPQTSGMEHLYASVAHANGYAGQTHANYGPEIDGVVALVIGDHVPSPQVSTRVQKDILANGTRFVTVVLTGAPDSVIGRFGPANIESCHEHADKLNGVCVEVDPFQNPKALIEIGLISAASVTGTLDKIPASLEPTTQVGQKFMDQCLTKFGR